MLPKLPLWLARLRSRNAASKSTGRFSEPIPLNLIAYIKHVEHESRLSYFVKLAVKLESLEAFQSAIGE